MAKERNSAIEMINRYYREHRAVAGKAGQGKEWRRLLGSSIQSVDGIGMESRRSFALMGS